VVDLGLRSEVVKHRRGLVAGWADRRRLRRQREMVQNLLNGSRLLNSSNHPYGIATEFEYRNVNVEHAAKESRPTVVLGLWFRRL
jgi:hypothetical protein